MRSILAKPVAVAKPQSDVCINNQGERRQRPCEETRQDHLQITSLPWHDIAPWVWLCFDADQPVKMDKQCQLSVYMIVTRKMLDGHLPPARKHWCGCFLNKPVKTDKRGSIPAVWYRAIPDHHLAGWIMNFTAPNHFWTLTASYFSQRLMKN